MTWRYCLAGIALLAICSVPPLCAGAIGLVYYLPAITGNPAVQILEPPPGLPGLPAAPPASDSPGGTPARPPVALPTGGPPPTTGRGAPVKIVALGDSLTEGDGDSLGIGYPGRLAIQLEGRRPGSTVENYGRSGWTSTELISGSNGEPGQLDAAIASRPAVALIWIGSNDLWQLYDFGSPNQADEDRDLANFSANIDRIMTRLKAAGIKIVIAQHDDQAKRPGATTATLPGVTPAEFRRMSQQVVRYNDAIRQRATQHGASVVNFFPTTIFTDRRTISEDGIHPNDAGHEIIAKMWLDAVLPLLP